MNKFISDVKRLKIRKFIFDIKQLKMNTFVKYLFDKIFINITNRHRHL